MHVEGPVGVGHVVHVEVDGRQHRHQAGEAGLLGRLPAGRRPAGSRRRRRGRRAGTSAAACGGGAGARPGPGSTTTAEAVRWSGRLARSRGSAGPATQGQDPRPDRLLVGVQGGRRRRGDRARARSPGRWRGAGVGRGRAPPSARRRGARRSPGPPRHVGIAGPVPAPRQVGPRSRARCGCWSPAGHPGRPPSSASHTPRSAVTRSAPPKAAVDPEGLGEPGRARR